MGDASLWDSMYQCPGVGPSVTHMWSRKAVAVVGVAKHRESGRRGSGRAGPCKGVSVFPKVYGMPSETSQPRQDVV